MAVSDHELSNVIHVLHQAGYKLSYRDISWNSLRRNHVATHLSQTSICILIRVQDLEFPRLRKGHSVLIFDTVTFCKARNTCNILCYFPIIYENVTKFAEFTRNFGK